MWITLRNGAVETQGGETPSDPEAWVWNWVKIHTYNTWGGTRGTGEFARETYRWRFEALVLGEAGYRRSMSTQRFYAQTRDLLTRMPRRLQPVWDTPLGTVRGCKRDARRVPPEELGIPPALPVFWAWRFKEVRRMRPHLRWRA